MYSQNGLTNIISLSTQNLFQGTNCAYIHLKNFKLLSSVNICFKRINRQDSSCYPVGNKNNEKMVLCSTRGKVALFHRVQQIFPRVEFHEASSHLTMTKILQCLFQLLRSGFEVVFDPRLLQRCSTVSFVRTNGAQVCRV